MGIKSSYFVSRSEAERVIFKKVLDLKELTSIQLADILEILMETDLEHKYENYIVLSDENVEIEKQRGSRVMYFNEI